jgi:hypothetical protein
MKSVEKSSVYDPNLFLLVTSDDKSRHCQQSVKSKKIFKLSI